VIRQAGGGDGRGEEGPVRRAASGPALMPAEREKTAIKSPYLNIINEITVLTARAACSIITAGWQFGPFNRRCQY